MSHSNTEQLIDYWRSRAEPGVAPPRASIDPSELTHLLPQIFILRRQAPRQFNFRLVGGLVADLHGRDLREEPFLRIWDPDDRADLSLALEASRRQAEPIVIECLGESHTGARVEMEILLAPLTSADGEVDRLLGFYQPLTPVAALTGRPIAALSLGRIRVFGDGRSQAAATFPHLRLATLDGRHVG
jgi:hypothetical protein